MRGFGKSLKVSLGIGFAFVLLVVCSGLFVAFDLQSRQSAIDAAQARQAASLRVLVDKFASRFDGIEMSLSDDGTITAVRWPALEVPGSHDLIDEVGMVSGETATLFQWVPEEGDFIRRTTNIVKPDGSRAVGTWLGKENPVHARMLAREAFNGEAVILGKPYYTVYQPILDAQNNVIGIFYVGVDRSLVDQQIAERLTLGVIASVVAALFGILAMAFLIGRALRPLHRVSERLKAMAEGDLDQPVPDTDRSDELGTSARVVETFRNQLIEARAMEVRGAEEKEVQDKVVSSLRKALESLANKDLNVRIDPADFPDEYEALRLDFDAGIASLSEALAQTGSVASNVRTAAMEIGSTSDELAHRVEMQAGTLMKSAEALNGLTGTSREIASNVEEADKLALKSRQMSDESGQVVQDAIAAINRIEEASDKINQIITAIDDIAFQTNLLALNAGVEAARAGSAGKGFAVVASEVRSLAQTAANSAQEIKSLILRSSEEVSEGSRLVQKTGTSLNEVQEQVQSLGQLISNIAGAVRVQTDGLGEINEGVQRLEGATQENAAIVEELNAAGQGLNIEAEKLTETMSVFGQQSGNASGGWETPAASPKVTTPPPPEPELSEPAQEVEKFESSSKQPEQEGNPFADFDLVDEPMEEEVKQAVNAPTPLPTQEAGKSSKAAPLSGSYQNSTSMDDWGEEF